MRYDYDLTVIGGGSGGLVAARLGQAFGAKVALIDKVRLGGDCLYTGCVPSKTLIHIAKIAHSMRNGAQQGVLGTIPGIAMSHIAATIAGVIDHVRREEQVYVEGVDVKFGQVAFTNPHTVQINGAPLTSKSFIIATGSHPAIPDLPGLSDGAYLTNEQVFHLDHLPASLAVVGGGPIGCELSQAFARLGSKVTLIQCAQRLLTKEDPDVSRVIRESLEKDGVQVYLHTHIQQVTQHNSGYMLTCQDTDGAITSVQVDALLLAVGRKPNIDGLDLEKAGVHYTTKGISVDAKLRTSMSHTYAIGDVIGANMFTHVAAAQAGVAAPNALLPGLLNRSMRYSEIPWVTYTDPEAARVGLTAEQARQQYGSMVHVQTIPFASIDRAQTEGATSGFIKLILGKQDAILGAHIVGAHAGEMLAEVTLAMRHHLGVAGIIATIHAYPTFATGLQQVAFEAYLQGSSFANAKKIVQRFLPKR